MQDDNEASIDSLNNIGVRDEQQEVGASNIGQ